MHTYTRTYTKAMSNLANKLPAANGISIEKDTRNKKRDTLTQITHTVKSIFFLEKKTYSRTHAHTYTAYSSASHVERRSRYTLSISIPCIQFFFFL